MFGPDTDVPLDVPASCFVAVHVGSGCHSRTRENLYLEALTRACQTASGASDCMTGVSRAVKALEEAEVTNAGLGSNLTLEGSVEADASIMLGDRTFAAVGAAPGLGSAIEAAAMLAGESRQPLALGRVRPMFLAGHKAWDWAKSRGLTTAASLDTATQWHVSHRALKQWIKYRDMIAQDAERQSKHQPQLSQPDQELTQADLERTQETPQLQTSCSAAFMEKEIARQPRCDSSAEVATAAASQLASTHAPRTLLSQHAHAVQRPDAAVATAPGVHGRKRSAADMDTDSSSPVVSCKAKQQKQEVSCGAELPLLGEEDKEEPHATQPAGEQRHAWLHGPHLTDPKQQRHEPIPGTQPAVTEYRLHCSHTAHPAVLTQEHDSQPQDCQQEAFDSDGSCLNDTVGAIFIDASGRVGAGVSSGGIVMKTPGRVGEAAMYACGCWAQDADLAHDRPGVACSASGVGEVIMRACLAKECCQRMLNQTLSVDEACSQVMQETTMQEAQPNDCGVLAVRFCIRGRMGQEPARAEIECAAVHCSKSMGFALSSQTCPHPKCQILRQQHSGASNQQLAYTGYFSSCDLPNHL